MRHKILVTVEPRRAGAVRATVNGRRRDPTTAGPARVRPRLRPGHDDRRVLPRRGAPPRRGSTDGLTRVAKTSGAKVMQLYAGLRAASTTSPSAYAKTLAERLAAETPDLVMATMANKPPRWQGLHRLEPEQPGQRPRSRRTHCAAAQPDRVHPLTWEEVCGCHDPEQLVFTADDVLDRVEEHGDLFAHFDETSTICPLR